METFVERLFEFMAAKGLTQNKFETTCGLSHTDLRKLKQGPTAGYLMQILTKFPDLSMDWLFRGTGSMLLGESSQQKPETQQKVVLNDIHDNPNVMINYLHDAIKEAIKEAYTEIKKENKQ